MIREERLQSTKVMIKKYANSRYILKANYDNVCDIIKDMQKNNKKLFINAFGDDFTLEEEMKIKKMYSKALKDLGKFNREKNKYKNKCCFIVTVTGEQFICIVLLDLDSSFHIKSEFGFGCIYKDNIKKISIIDDCVNE